MEEGQRKLLIYQNWVSIIENLMNFVEKDAIVFNR